MVQAAIPQAQRVIEPASWVSDARPALGFLLFGLVVVRPRKVAGVLVTRHGRSL